MMLLEVHVILIPGTLIVEEVLAQVHSNLSNHSANSDTDHDIRKSVRRTVYLNALH